ncbi:hypothetical protein [Salsipaludibacter albus]|uniref:hypothetical protein n=1 Tax=Salsipaludibacter albus TaxID=2849650 RepID=UPI001EE3FE1C|nr:hypothetical protein [Salsipaludibacter albus]MBY5162769.1 hypothetical protein [Salsipaludibacter albus]
MEPDERPLRVDDRVRGVMADLDTRPSDDLLDRVRAAISADVVRRRRRRRILAIVVVAAVAIGLVALQRGPLGWFLDWRLLEVVETLVMLGLVVGIRPLLDRVGSDFLAACLGGSVEAASRLAPLLDLAWNLVFVGITLMSTSFAPTVPVTATWAAQLDQGLERVGGLLLAMGVLHGVTFLGLPLAGVAYRAATTGRPMPRWTMILMAVVGVFGALVVLNLVLGIGGAVNAG